MIQCFQINVVHDINKMKGKKSYNHPNETLFDKIQHLFDKNSKVCKKGTFLNKIKATYDKPTANIILNDERLKVFPLKTRNKTRMLTLIIFNPMWY